MKHLITLLILVCCIGTSLSAQDYDGLIEAAKAKKKAKDYNAAVVLMEKALKIDSSKLDDVLLYANTIANGYDIVEAIKYLETRTADFKENSDYHAELAYYNQRQGRIRAALIHIEDAISTAENDSLDLLYTSLKADYKYHSGNFESAEKIYDEILKKDEDHINSLNGLALVYLETDRPLKGIELLKKLLEFEDLKDLALHNIAYTYSKIDSLETSLKYFDDLINKDYPKEKEYLLAYPLNNRGFVHYRLRNYDQALEDIKRSLEIDHQNSYAYKNLALVYLATDRNDEACENLVNAYLYGYHKFWGEEVNELLDKHCKHLKKE